MTDWTTVATAAIAAGGTAIGALLGYLAARLQVFGELRKLEAQNREAHFQHRQGVYHDFLDSAVRFHHHAGGAYPFETAAAYHEWAQSVEHTRNAVGLFGTKAAWLAAQNLADRIEDVIQASASNDGKYSGDTEDRFIAAYRETIEAMRPDTAPEA